MPGKFKVFISHSSAQDGIVSEIATYVGRDWVHLDIHDFEKGQDLSKEIEANINNSTLFVLLLSDKALDSDWVKKELNIVKVKIVDEEIIGFLPMIVDETISVDDERLDNKPWKWVKEHLVKIVLSPKMAARVISRRLNEQILEYNPVIREREKLFFGRDTDMSELQLKLYSSRSNDKRAVIVSGMDHVGRKRLLQEFITQHVRDVHDFYTPIKVIMTDTDGIEQLIQQLNEYLQLYNGSDLICRMKNSNSNVELAVQMLNQIVESQERIFIRDEKCIVLGNGKLTDWFVDLIMNKNLLPMLHFFIASKYTPNASVERNFPSVIAKQIKALDSRNMGALFNAYARNRNISPSDEETKYFLGSLNGYPKQVYDVVNAIADYGMLEAKKQLPLIVAMFDGHLYEIIKELEKTPHAKEILVLFSMFDFVSEELLSQVCPDDIRQAFEEFNKYSLYESFGSSNRYMRLNAGMANYISRNKMDLPSHYVRKFREVARKLLSELDSSLTDLSSQLLAIKELLRDPGAKTKAKEQFLLPQFVLKVIVEEYNAKHNDNVISLVEMLLNDRVRKGYDEINRSIHYWYCCALCRTKNSKFHEVVEYFKESLYSYYFLKGFYERHLGHFEAAEEYYQRALDQSKAVGEKEYLSKAENEMVIVKMELGDYNGAHQLAKKSYEHDKSNSYHIESYFRCIVNSVHPDGTIMKELIDRMELSYAKNKEEIVPSMKAQYLYYIGHDFQAAVSDLTIIIEKERPDSSGYARRALKEICQHKDSIQTYYSIIRKMKGKP